MFVVSKRSGDKTYVYGYIHGGGSPLEGMKACRLHDCSMTPFITILYPESDHGINVLSKPSPADSEDFFRANKPSMDKEAGMVMLLFRQKSLSECLGRLP